MMNLKDRRCLIALGDNVKTRIREARNDEKPRHPLLRIQASDPNPPKVWSKFSLPSECKKLIQASQEQREADLNNEYHAHLQRFLQVDFSSAESEKQAKDLSILYDQNVRKINAYYEEERSRIVRDMRQ